MLMVACLGFNTRQVDGSMMHGFDCPYPDFLFGPTDTNKDGSTVATGWGLAHKCGLSAADATPDEEDVPGALARAEGEEGEEDDDGDDEWGEDDDAWHEGDHHWHEDKDQWAEHKEEHEDEEEQEVEL